MQDIKYFSQRKQNKLTSIRFYIIFILFIHKLSPLFCQANDYFGDEFGNFDFDGDFDDEDDYNEGTKELTTSAHYSINPEFIYNKIKNELILNYDKNVSKALRQSPIWDHIIFIGKKELNDNINGKFPEFWNILIENLNINYFQ